MTCCHAIPPNLQGKIEHKITNVIMITCARISTTNSELPRNGHRPMLKALINENIWKLPHKAPLIVTGTDLINKGRATLI